MVAHTFGIPFQYLGPSDKLNRLLPIFFVRTKYVLGTETQNLQQVIYPRY
jgi:hypothetical protein